MRQSILLGYTDHSGEEAIPELDHDPTTSGDRRHRWNLLGTHHGTRVRQSCRYLNKLATTVATVLHVDDAAWISAERPHQRTQTPGGPPGVPSRLLIECTVAPASTRPSRR